MEKSEMNGGLARLFWMGKYFAMILIVGALALASLGLVLPQLPFVALASMFLMALAMLVVGCSLWKTNDLYWQ